MASFATKMGESFDGGMLGAVVKIVFGLLLSVLSFSAMKLMDRMECAERSIVELQIMGAARTERVNAIEVTLTRIEQKVDKLIDARLK